MHNIFVACCSYTLDLSGFHLGNILVTKDPVVLFFCWLQNLFHSLIHLRTNFRGNPNYYKQDNICKQSGILKYVYQSPNVSTTLITALGCRQCLPLSVVQLKGKHCRKPHCRNGVVDTFGKNVIWLFISISLNIQWDRTTWKFKS
jgi:hypothetical protein